MNRPLGFPTHRDYETALRNYSKSFRWDRLTDAVPRPSPSGISYFWGAGAFAIVSKVSISGTEWALRLPIGPQDGIHERSLAIAEEVANGNPLFVPFEYSVAGIEAPVGSGQIRPVTLMQWVEGLTVRDFVIESCIKGDSKSLLKLRDAFVKLARDLKSWGIAHGDLSPDNIFVGDEDGETKLQLVDYDSVFIERVGDIPTSVGLTPMRHPAGPRQPDSSSDLFPLLIYYSVLTALAANPSLGVSPDHYDQKFLVDARTLGNPSNSQLLRALIDAAPAELNALIESLKDDYSKTPSIVKAVENFPESTKVILASDWVELTKRSGLTIEINGTVLGSPIKDSFVLMKPSPLNRYTTVAVQDLGFPKIHFKIGDQIRAIGTVRVLNSQIVLLAPYVELIESNSNKSRNDAQFSAASNRIRVLKQALQIRKNTAIRVHEIAAELKMTNAEVIDLSHKLGIGVKGPSSTISARHADRIRARANRDGLGRG